MLMILSQRGTAARRKKSMRRMKTEMVRRLMYRQRGRGRIKMIQMIQMMVERMTRDHPSDRVRPLLSFSRLFLFSFNFEFKKKCKMVSFQWF